MKLSEDDRQLAFEDLSIALAEVQEAKLQRGMTSDPAPAAAKPAIKRTIGNLPADLPRIVQVIKPDSLICPCGCDCVIPFGPMAQHDDCTRSAKTQ